MTQTQLADLLDVSARSVQDYERGITVPWRHFQRLEQIFPNRSLRWFLHGEPEPRMRRTDELQALLDVKDDLGRSHDALKAQLDVLLEGQRLISLRLDELERQQRGR